MSVGAASNDWQVQLSRAMPVSSPLQNEEVGYIDSQPDTHGGAFWAITAGRTSSNEAARDKSWLNMMPVEPRYLMLSSAGWRMTTNN